jgi:hypothetical protein
MLSSFLGVLPILTPPLCTLPLSCDQKSNPLVVFALDLMSAYEGEHTIFGLLGQANLTQNDVLQFHPFIPPALFVMGIFEIGSHQLPV